MDPTVMWVVFVAGSTVAIGYLGRNSYALYVANRTHEKRRAYDRVGAVSIAAGTLIFLLREGLRLAHWLPVSLVLVVVTVGLGLGYGELRKRGEPPSPEWQPSLPQRYMRLAAALLAGIAGGFVFACLVSALVSL